MANITISAGALGARIRADHKGAPQAVKKAMFSAAQRGKAFIVGRTPVDRGILRNAWKVIRHTDGAELVNDQPYAGVMERGARPFKMSRAGREAIREWVKRKILKGAIQRVKHQNSDTSKMSWKDARAAQKTSKKLRSAGWKAEAKWKLDDEAESISWAIVKHFEKVGIRGKRFVYLHLEILARLMDLEIDRYLSNFFNRPSGK